jgi:hypothetical protein
MALTVWPFTESRSMMAARTGDATAATKVADHPVPAISVMLTTRLW